MKKTIATIAASTALLAGCGSEREPQKQRIIAPTEVAPLSYEMQEYYKRSPVFSSLTDFRNRITRERRARVVLGMCAVWSNLKGGLIATVNPGMVSEDTKEGDHFNYFVFSHTDQTRQPATLIQMNSPLTAEDKHGRVVEESPVAIMLYRPDGSVQTKDRLLSKQPSYDAAGRGRFTDKETGEPLMLTGYFPGQSLDESTVSQSCRALLDQTPGPADSNSFNS